MSEVRDILDVDVKLKSDTFQEVFERLNDKELDKISKRATSAAAAIIKAEAKKQLKQHTGKAKSTYTNAKHGWNLIKSKKTGKVIGVKSLEQGIVAKYHRDEAMSKVNIMGDFRLKWMEKGTQSRYAKLKSGAKAHRGQMPEWRFFHDAIQLKSESAWYRMQEIINRNIEAIMLVRGGA